jgi:hypothetical protein
MLHLASSLVLCLIVAGVLTRRAPRLHLRFMTVAFLTDLALVIYIEATRHAVEKVATQTGALLWFHALVSLCVLAAYIVQIALGRRLLAGILTQRRTHIIVGVAFCSLRALNYVTSFML